MSGEVETARVRVLERDVRRFGERADAIDAEFGDRRHSATWRGLVKSRQAELADAREELRKAERPRSVAAADVTPGQALWNPYGGSRGNFIAASEPRHMPDGSIEIDAEDGRTGRFRPGYELHLNWRAMDMRDAELEAEL